MSKYSKALAERICVAVMQGEHIRAIADMPGMPAASTIYLWLARNETFRELYATAKQHQMDAMAEEVLAIADDGTNDWIPLTDKEGNPTGAVKLDKEAVMRSKLRIDTRRWLMSKYAPKKYGDKVQVEASGPDGGPIQTKNENVPVTVPALDLVMAKLAKLAGVAKPDDDDDGPPEPAGS